MELIKRYIYAIERRLPRGKEDIAKEIESLIMDELEGEFGAKAEYVKEEIEPVLKEMGSPRVVAQRYRGSSDYVIGPELGYFYRMVIGIVSGATTLGLTISYIVGRFTVAESFWQGIGALAAYLGSVFSSVLAAVGAVTIVFMLIERFGDTKKMDIDMDSEWRPRDLPDMPIESDRVRIAEPIVAIIFTVIWAVVINTYAQTGGIFAMQNVSNSLTIVPMFNIDVVRVVLPVWNLSIAVTLVTQIILLKQGKWQPGTRMVEIAGQIVSIIGIVILLGQAPLFSLDWLVGLDAEVALWATNMKQWYYIGLKTAMVVTAIGIVVNIIKAVVKAVRKTDIA